MTAVVTIQHWAVFALLLLGCFGLGLGVAMTYAHYRTYQAAMKLLEMLDILVVAKGEAEALRREWKHRTDDEEKE